MPRRREVPKREILPDPKFGDLLVAKFVNMLMKHGKKSTAEKILYLAFDSVNNKSGQDGLEGRQAEEKEETVEDLRIREGGHTGVGPGRTKEEEARTSEDGSGVLLRGVV